MEELNGTSIFWLLAIGLFIGALAKLTMGSKGVGLVANILAGAVSSALVGSVGLAMQMPGSLLFALLGSLSVLFLVNVFYAQSGEHYEEPTH